LNHNREHRDRPKAEKPKRGGGSPRTKLRRFQRKMAKKCGEQWYRMTYTDYRYSWLANNDPDFNQHELP